MDFGWTFLRGGNVLGSELGRSVATPGDVNGDGYADVLVGGRRPMAATQLRRVPIESSLQRARLAARLTASPPASPSP